MHYGADFLHFIAVYLLILIVPGPDFAIVLRETLLFGRRSGVLAAFGVAAAMVVHCAYTILGLGLIIAQSLLLFTVIKWAGIAYLLYIGVKALTAKKRGGTDIMAAAAAEMQAKPARKAFMAGFLCNLLNPKCLLFFLSMFSAMIAPATPAVIKALDGAAAVVCSGLWFLCVAFFFTVPRISHIYRRASLWINRVTGAVFIALGISLIFRKARV